MAQQQHVRAEAVTPGPSLMDLPRARAVLSAGARFERFVAADVPCQSVFVVAAPRLAVDTAPPSPGPNSAADAQQPAPADKQLVLWRSPSPEELEASARLPRPPDPEYGMRLFTRRNVDKGALSELLAVAVAASESADRRRRGGNSP